ncbi:MAG: LamG domain-containing protein [Planctomycetales bacterium]|nr:LamG domain-containing protein [Planctomycetales bacterium]
MYVNSYPFLILGHPNSYNGMRFSGVNIPQGATIQSAYLEFTSSHTLSTSPCQATIQGIAQDNPPAFSTSSNDISSRPTTSAAAPWTLPNTTAGATLQSPDLTSVIQELVDRPGYAAGNNLALVVTPGTSSTYRLVWQYDGQPTSVARLHVTYTTTAPEPLVHWRLDETSGSSLDNDGTLGSAADASLSGSYSLDQQALIVDGGRSVRLSGGTFSPGSVSQLDSSPFYARTIELWFKTDTVSGNQMLWSEGAGTRGNAIYLYGSTLYMTAWNRASDGTGAPWGLGPPVTVSCPTAIQPGKIYFVVMVLDGNASSTGSLVGYLNGAEFNTASGVGQTYGHAAVNLGNSSGERLHTNSTSNGNMPYAGVMDDVKVWGSALTAEIIADHYTEGSGLVAHWKLDDGSGATAADESPNGNDATVGSGSPTWVSGVRGGALGFAGGDRMDAGTFEVAGDSLTLATWAYVETGSDEARLIVRSDGNGQNNQSWGLTADENGNVDFRVHAGGAWDRVEAAGAIEEGQWRHIAGAYDGATMRLYIDGVLVQSKSHSSGGDLDSYPAHTVTMGDSVSGYREFNGLLDDVRVYSRALSAGHIAELYGLVGHWKLDEASGTTAADSSGSSNDGTHNGGVTVYAVGPYPGVGDAAAEYDGLNDYTDLPDLGFDFSDGFAAAFWLRPESAPTSSYGMLGVSNGQNVDDIRVGWQAGSGIELSLSDTLDGSSQTGLTDSKEPEVDRWQHCIVSVDSSGNATIYREGVAVASGYVSLPNNANRTENFIGTTVWNDAFPGRLFDVRLYNRSLLPHEVEAIYGLVGHWKLDESSGTMAAESTASPNDGQYQSGPLLDQSGKVDRAVEFDGQNDRVEVASTRAFSSHMTTGQSVAAWVKVLAMDTDSHGQTRQPIVAKGFYSPWEWALYVYDSGAAGFSTWQSGGSSHSEISGGSLPVGVWKHVAGVYEPGVGTRLYVDAVEVSAGTTLSGVITPGNRPVLIGARQDGQYLNAVIDDVRVYNRPVSPDEIEQLFKGNERRGIRIIRWVEVR